MLFPFAMLASRCFHGITFKAIPDLDTLWMAHPFLYSKVPRRGRFPPGCGLPYGGRKPPSLEVGVVPLFGVTKRAVLA